MNAIPPEKAAAADRIRRKAEARRLRILAKSAQRLDVVDGLPPKSEPSVASNSIAVTPTSVDGSVAVGTFELNGDTPARTADAAAPVENREPTPSTTPPGDNDDANKSSTAAPAATEAAAEPPARTQSAGARRMAAARRRRYKSKSKVDESSAPDAGGSKEEAKVEIKKEEGAVDDSVAKDSDKAKKSVDVKKEDTAEAVSESKPAEPEPKAKTVPGATVEKKAAPVTKKEEGEKESQPTKAKASPTNKSTTTDAEEKKDDKEPKKKYMGVARMRRKLLKEQKAQRLKDISDAEIIGSVNSGEDLERELVAEMATMDMTASMMRSGGIVLDDSIGKKVKKRWFSAFIPPVKLMPRMATLLLLFFAGLDLGSQPHRSAGSPFSDVVTPSMARSLAGDDVGVGLIKHVEPSLTKPWEYGMGGRAAYMVGMAPSSPPTMMPTSFDADMVCTANDVTEECLSPNKQPKEKTGSVKNDKGGKKQKKNIKVQLMEDEFDNSRNLPRGVSHDDHEFDDDGTIKGPPNIDPLFQVDFDALLRNAELPLPIDFAAKIAIGFHRTWVYYVWTLPTSLVKSMVHMPKNFLSGWISNPPWILGVVLVIRFLGKLLMGNGKSAFSLDLDKDDSASGGDDAGGGNNLDLLGKAKDFAKNYMKSKFPKSTLVLGTMMSLMKVDMYVVLCGMLMGLVMPLAKEDYIAWSGGTGQWYKPALGDDEL